MSPLLVGKLIDHIHSLWRVNGDVEITLETNPTTFEREKFKEFSIAGVNRLSLGVQSLKEKDLKLLGRQHTVPEALTAIEEGLKIFPRLSGDFNLDFEEVSPATNPETETPYPSL